MIERKKIITLGRGYNFSYLFKSGRKIDTPYFKVHFLKNKLSYSRFAFVVPRRVHKSAVVRNKLRRRLKEWIRQQTDIVGKQLDIVFIVKSKAVFCSRKEFYEKLNNILKTIEDHRSSAYNSN